MHEQLAALPRLLTAHLELCLFALLGGICVSIPLGVVASRVRWLEQVVLSIAALIQTVPSLALLALMVPLLGAMGLTSIGYLPAFIALLLYSTLPILGNTVVALTGVDPAAREAAQGVGMSSTEQLFRVELPLALPVIMAGIRTATVWTVGAATLATPVGADSLGNYIFSGLQTRNTQAVLVGCVGSAALALVLDGLAKLLLTGVTRRSRTLVVLASTVFGAMYFYAGFSLASTSSRSSKDVVVIGAKTFTEQYILSEILARQIRRTTELSTEVKQSLGSSIVFDALRSGAVDVYVDYSGTIWSTVMKRASDATGPKQMLSEVEHYLRDDYGIAVVAPLGFANSYALAMKRVRADELGVRRISDLTVLAPTLEIGGDYEFFGRPEWAGIRSRYGLSFGRQRLMDSALMYQAVAQGSVDVVSAFSTDGRIAAMDLVVLEDDRGAIPPYDAIVLASRRLCDTHPEVVEALSELRLRIDADAMRRMNRAVDEGKESASEVAGAFVAGLHAEATAARTP